jgi:hypothetical protein
MKIQLSITHFIGSIVSFLISYFTLTGEIQKHIHFAGSLNELAFCAISFSLGILLLISSIELPKKA